MKKINYRENMTATELVMALKSYIKENLQEEKRFVAMLLCSRLADEVKKYES